MQRAITNFTMWTVLAVALVALGAGPVLAAGRDYDCDAVSIGRLGALQTRTALANFVRCAEQHVADVGWSQAEDDFHNDAGWKDGAMYLFAIDTHGLGIFNASRQTAPGDANDRLDRTDVDGKMYRRRFVYTAGTFGSGFVTYRFGNPATGEIAPKVAYVMSVRESYGERSAILGAGFYPEAAPGACSPGRVRASRVFTNADVERFVRCAELELKRRGLVVLHEFRTDPRWISGPTYLGLVDRETLVSVVHGANPALEGQALGALVDSAGFAFMQESAAIAEHFGDGYVYYEYANPATGAVEPKGTYVRNVRVGGFDYIMGAGLYIPANMDCLDMPVAADVDTRAELELFVACAADLVAARGSEAFDLLLHHLSWIEGSTYIFVNDQLCRTVVYPLDYRVDRGISWTHWEVFRPCREVAGRWGAVCGPETGGHRLPVCDSGVGSGNAVGIRAGAIGPRAGAASAGDGGLWNVGAGFRRRGATGSAGRRCGRGPARG